MIKKSLMILCALLLFSCSDEVEQPKDELEDLGHDIWHTVTFSFIEGEVAQNGVFTGYKHDEGLVFKTVQDYTFFLADDLTVQSKSEPLKLVQGNTYGLVIQYYNSKGKLMNEQFTTPEMAPIHQHFFMTPLKSSLRQTEKKVIDYVYRDTNPTNKTLAEGATLRDENDPIGLKGYFKVFEKPESEFDFRPVLVHVLGATKLDENGKPYLFYQRTKLVNGTTDLDQKIPMEVFTDKNSATFLDDVADEFSITKDQVLKEIESRKLDETVKL